MPTFAPLAPANIDVNSIVNGPPRLYAHGRTGDLERAREVLAIRAAGYSFDVIARVCGYASPDSARRAATVTAPRVVARANARLITRSFGVELEYVSRTHNRGEVANLISQAGVACSEEGYNHTTRRRFKVVSDGSVSGGGEVVSPILSPASGGFETLTTVMNAMSGGGACSVDRQTGMHVHVDVRDLSRVQILNAVVLYARFQDEIDLLLAPSRREGANSYCRRHGQGEIEDYRRGNFPTYADRYRTVNLASVPRYGSLEFRQHQGTLNPEKARAWIEFVSSIVRAAERGLTDQIVGTTIGDLMDGLVEHAALGRTYADYLIARHTANVTRSADADPADS